MAQERRLFSSESVSCGHPDKVADQVSDAVLDACLAGDPDSRVACEALVTTGLVVLAGEITTKAGLDFQSLVRNTLEEIGYTREDYGMDYKACGVLVALDKQSPDIAQGVNEGEGLFQDQGAGDQGMMFGYACKETPAYMPFPIYYAHRLMEKHKAVRESGTIPYFGPDAKCQVTVEYDKNWMPKRVDTVVFSGQHLDSWEGKKVTHEQIEKDVREKIVQDVIPAEFLDGETKYLVNPTGRFVIGGPHGDCGLTGRKIIVDTYGGMGRHGGGAFSGKDPTKVDRSAAYAARWVAKNVVAAGLADRCEIQLSYAIGKAEPVSIWAETFGTGKVPFEKLVAAVREVFDLRPGAIIQELGLKKPIFKKTAAFGHFGREGFPWEELNKVEALKKLV